MSPDEAYEALEKAIQERVNSLSAGDYVAGWQLTIMTALPGQDDGHGYWYEASDGPIHHKLGLIDMAREHYHKNMQVDYHEDD